MNTKRLVLCTLWLTTTLLSIEQPIPEIPFPEFTLPAEQKEIPDESISTKDILTFIHPLLQTKSIEAAIKLIADNKTSADVAQNVVKRVLKSATYQKELTTEDKIQFILGMTNLFKDSAPQNDTFFIYIQDIPQTKNDAPTLFLAAKGTYPDTLTPLIAWFSRTKGEKSTEKEKNKALMYAAQHGQHTVLKTLEDHGVKITPELASSLLWQAVIHEAALPTVAFLLSKGANPSYHPKKATSTMLMEAIKHTKSEKMPILKALVQAKEKEGAKELKAFLNEHALLAKNDEITPLEVAGNMPKPLGPAIIKYLIEKGEEE